MFLKILQSSQENNCARVSFLIKLPATLLKKRFWHGCFPVNFAKRLRAPFLQNTSGRLLLEYVRLHLHIHVGYTKQPQSISEILSVVCKLTYGRTDLLDFM